MRRSSWVSIALGLLAVACADPPTTEAPTREARQPVVYGEDDRIDVYAHPDEALRTLARQSIVKLVSRDAVDRDDPEAFSISGSTLENRHDLCAGEPFADQRVAGGCSATLIGPDTVLTAGHCISPAECPDEVFVFDYWYEAEGVLATITEDDVYACRRLLAWRDDDELDYAVVQLDRRVTPDRVPAPIRVVEPLEVGTPLTMIGFPNGIPAKIDTGGRVILPGEAPWNELEATVDAFGGNSGSGIFDADRHVVAILEGGRTDYIDDEGCRVVNRLADDIDDAESLVYVGRALEGLCAAEPLHALCAPPVEGAGWCDACDRDAECRDGWICDGTCRAPCADDTECISDHACEGGRCVPQTRFECRGTEIWAVPACAPSRLREDCGPDAVCIDGACGAPNPGNRCEDAIEIAGVDGEYVGQTERGFSDVYRGDCAGGGPEVVYTFAVDAPVRLIASATGYDTVLYVRRDCDVEQEVGCNDDRARRQVHALLEVELSPGRYHLFVDGYDGAGEYTLTVDFVGECADCVDAGIEDAGVDAEIADAEPIDAEVDSAVDAVVDAASPEDQFIAPPLDAEVPDAERPDPDAAPVDASPPDAAPLDRGPEPDAAPRDVAVPDATPPDATLPDATLPDAAEPDQAIEPDAAPPDAETVDMAPADPDAQRVADADVDAADSEVPPPDARTSSGGGGSQGCTATVGDGPSPITMLLLVLWLAGGRRRRDADGSAPPRQARKP